MRVFVSGATGAIGMALVPQLVQRGHDVVAATRSPSKVPAVEAMGATAVVVDVLDEAAVSDAVRRVQPEVIVHQATALSGTPDLRRFDRWFATTNRLRTEGTDHLLAAAHAANTGRFVAQSYIGWNNSSDGGPVKTEDDPLDPDPLPAQRESFEAIRRLEQAVSEAPVEGLVLRFGNFYGPGASEGLVELVRRRRFPIVGDGGGVWSWIHVGDAASATVTAVEGGDPGIYNVVDDEPAPVSTWLPALAEAVGAKRPRRVPRWVGRLAAGAVPVRWMTEGRGASNERIKRKLGWQPSWTSWRSGFRGGLGTAERGTRP
jgi:nucleoside-diphosphate-sugar epimerase